VPPIRAVPRSTRLCVGLTVVGGILVIAGLATGAVGETLRLDRGHGWHGAVLAAEILIATGMSGGMLLVAAVVVWHLSIQWRRHAPRGPVSRETFAGGSAQHKMTQIKDLYRAAEEMEDAELSARWEELRQRQYELIRQYFEQARVGGTDVGRGPG